VKSFRKRFRYGGATGSHRTSVVVFVGEDDGEEERSCRASLSKTLKREKREGEMNWTGRFTFI
jgi:hypothetical protein